MSLTCHPVWKYFLTTQRRRNNIRGKGDADKNISALDAKHAIYLLGAHRKLLTLRLGVGFVAETVRFLTTKQRDRIDTDFTCVHPPANVLYFFERC